MGKARSVSGLKWVKGEIFASLQRVRAWLEALVEQGGDESSLSDASAALVEVRGVLAALQLPGAARLAEEMALLCDSMHGRNAVAELEEPAEALMLALIHLRDYLDKLQVGFPNVPVVLLAAINDVRGCRGAPPFSEAELYVPTSVLRTTDLAMPEMQEALSRLAREIRPHFHRFLLQWLRDKSSNEGLVNLGQLFHQIQRYVQGGVFHELFLTAEAVVQGILDGSIPAEGPAKARISHLDKVIKPFSDEENAWPEAIAQNQLFTLLSLLTDCDSTSPLVLERKTTYNLDEVKAAGEQQANLDGSLEPETMAILIGEVEKELAPIKEILDLFSRGKREDLGALNGIAPQLERLANTLAVTGSDDLVSRMRTCAESAGQLASGTIPVDDRQLNEITDELLTVEDALRRLGSGASVPGEDMRDLGAITLREARVELAKAKESISALMRGPGDRRELREVPQLMHRVAGVLRVLSEEEVASLIDTVVEQVTQRYLDAGREPAQEEFESLAEAISGIELYIEGLSEGEQYRADLLAEVRRATEQLAAAPLRQTVVDVDKVERGLAGADEAVPGEESFASIDPEFREIFLEEALEEEQNIREQFDRWRRDEDDEVALATLRRSFHTLKGSGRLVGAKRVGDFGRAIEMLLNRVIDRTLDVSPELMQLLSESVAILPDLIEAEAHGKPLNAADLIARADRLAAAGVREADTSSGVLRRTEDVRDAKVIPWPASSASEEAEALPETAIPGDVPEAIELGKGEGVEGEETASSEEELLSASDAELIEIFRGETEEQLGIIDNFCTAFADDETTEIDEPLLRALHTIRGGARMTGVDSVAQVTEGLERLFRESSGAPAEQHAVTLLERASDLIRARLSSLPSSGDEIARLRALEPEIDECRERIRSAQIADETEAPATGTVEPEIDLSKPGKTPVAPALPPEPEAAEEPAFELDLEVEQPQVGEVEFEAVKEPAPAGEEPSLEEPAFELDLEVETPPVDEIELEAAKEHAPADEEPSLAAEGTIEHEDVPAGTAEAETPAEETLELSEEDELLDIFRGEALEHIGVIRDYVQRFHASPAVPEEAIVRALHTIKGSARMAEIGAVAEVAAPLERVYRLVRDADEVPDRELVDLLAAASEGMDTYLGGLPQGRDDTAQIGELAERARDALRRAEEEEEVGAPEEVAQQAVVSEPAPAELAGAEAAPEGELAEDYDPIPEDSEILNLFLEDARDILDKLDGALRELQLAPAEKGPLEEMQRLLHTLKGSARLSGLAAIGNLSHAFETLLTGITKGEARVNEDTLELAQSTVDTLSDQVEAVENRSPLRRAERLVRALSRAQESRVHTGDDEQALVMVRSEQEAPPIAEEAKEEPIPAGLPADEKKKTAEAVPQIRVRADLLNRLVNNAGEVGIYRARLSQQSGLIGFRLGEFDQTVTRLRDQLRHLEIETEAQILHRFERDSDLGAGPERAEFDPLELDRFSTMQQLSRSLAETVNDLVSLRTLLSDLRRESDTLLLQQARIADDLQDGLLRTRMVPFAQVVPRLHRVVRQTAQQLKKRARLEVYGPEVELDRGIQERMVAPLEHLLRNALAHGIETLDEREKAGKDPIGVITLMLSREGNDVVIKVSDDGRGLDLGAIRRRAVERGLVDESADTSDDEVAQMILVSGFSTAKKVTQIAGRGVGLDVVNSEIKQLSGSFTLETDPGRGTSFTIRLPLTLAIIEALLVQIGDDVFAIPHATVEACTRIARSELEASYKGETRVLRYVDQEYRVMYLGSMLQLDAVPELGDRRWLPVLLARSGDQRIALHVDNLIGSQRVVVKPLGPQLSSIRWLSGGTILADGRVSLIVDLLALMRSGIIHEYRPPIKPTQETARERACIMVVDDSLTVRRVTTRILRRQNLEVITAQDGVDALTLLEDRIPDLMLLDIEMPRMDGYELTRHMRRSTRLQDIPIIMITSRTGEKHRRFAMELGVDRYLGKPYQEADLIDEINTMLTERGK